MCGRFTRRTPLKVLAKLFDCPPLDEMPPSYNVAPTQPVAVVRQRKDSAAREMCWMRWGLIPFWASDPRIGSKLINARADSAATKPAFRTAFRSQRCLIPADGFYEWQATNGKKKQPYFVSLRAGQPFAFAGLWDRWRDAGGQTIESCSILTTDANELVRPIHDRMPVILDPAHYAAWLDSRPCDPGMLLELLRPPPASELTARRVGPHVNNARFDDPQCLAAPDEAATAN